MALLPHQWKIAATPLTDLTYPSIRGVLKVSAGNAFTTQDRFYGIIPQFVEPNDPSVFPRAINRLSGSTGRGCGERSDGR
ncbi:hypothetical protein HMSSN036_11430 [Paenibacillus macerans]|nr:hypothetical protein HMSSN036_11430 [Paenibacillus macerans]